MIVINRKATTTGQLANSPGSNSQASAHPPSASKSQDSQTPAKGRRRSFFFGLFSSSAADKSAPHHVATGTKLTKVQSPPAPSKQPVIRSLSPDLLRDPAFSSDPQSHLFNVGQHGRRSPAYNGDAGLKPEQLQPLTSGQQRQIWRPTLSPTHSPSTSPQLAVPDHSFTSASVSLQTASSSSPSTSIPSQQTDTCPPEPKPMPQAHHKLRLLNPDPDEPPPYEESGVARPIEKKAKPSLEVAGESVFTPSTSSTASSSSSVPQSNLSLPTATGQPEESPVDVPSFVSFLKPSAPVVNHLTFIPSQPEQRPSRSQPPIDMNQPSQLPRQKTLDSDTTMNASSHSIPSSSQPHRPPVVLAYHPPQPEAVQTQPMSQPLSSSFNGQQANDAHHSKPNGKKTEREKRLDLIDELDETNPLGMRFHNGGPYEAIQKVVRSHTTANEKQSRSHVKHKNSSSADAKGSSVVPFGGSLNLVPGQMLPHNFQPYVLPIPQRFAPQQRPPHQYQSHSQQSDHSQQSGHSQMSTHRYLAPAVNEFNPYDAHNPSAPRAPRVSPQPHASPAPVQAPIPAVHTKYPSQPLQQELHHSHSYEPSDPSYSDAMDESDAYGGIMEDFDLPPVPMPVPAPYRNVRNSAPVPRPPAQSTPDLNLQRANTAYTSRDTHMGRHPNNSQPSFIRQERSNGMVRQPTNGTPYIAPARLPNSNGYDYGSGQYSDPRHPYQAPPQQHLPPPQQYQGGPPPPDRHYTSSVQQSVTSSSSQWTGPQPLHIPRNLVMPTPLQNSPHNLSPQHHVDPRHQMHSSYAETSAGQARGSLPPSQLYRQPTSGNPPPNAYHAPKLQKRSSMTQVRQPHGSTSVSFAANYVEPAAIKKPAKRVLSKKR